MVGAWPLPSLSSWRMKELKQSSLTLSNAPGTPRPDPPTASWRGQRGGQPRLEGRGSRTCFPSPGPGVGRRTHARQLVARFCPAGGDCGARGGCPATVAKDIPLREPPPPLPLPPAVPGPHQRKTKTRAEETAADAPPEKPGQKARASSPRCPAAGVLALPTGSLPPALAAPRVLAPCLPSSFPPRAALCPAPSPACHQPRIFAAVPAMPALCAPGCTRRTGAPRPWPCSQLPGRTQIRPLPWPNTSPGEAGAPGGAGSRPGRRRLHSSGDSGGSAARALLADRAGTREGRSRGPGPPPLAPPLELRRGAPAASPQGSKLPKATEVGFCADIGPRSQNTALREVVSGRQSGPASRELASRGPAQRDGDLGWLKREDEGTELRNTRRGRVGVRQEGEGKQRETQANRDVRNRATEGMREAETR